MRPLFLGVTFSAFVLSACYSPGDGQAPPLETLYFPTGLALDTATLSDGKPAYLYVASSDFDLQYRSSALVSFDLDLVSKVVPQSCAPDGRCAVGTCDNLETGGHVPSFFCVADPNDPCGAFGNRSAADQLLNPGRCQAIDPSRPQDGSPKLIKSAVGIGAFATDVILRANPDAPTEGRLFLPVRGDATLHWIDLTPGGEFRCGQSNTDDGSCDGAHRSGDLTSDNSNKLRQPPEPFGIDANADGTYIAVTNQTTGSVSLFVNDWQGSNGATLERILPGLPQAPVAIAALPQFALPDTVNPGSGFLVAYRNAAQIDLLRVRQEDPVQSSTGTDYTRYVLAPAGTAPINANSIGFDSRGIVVDDEARQSDYAACNVENCDLLDETAKSACQQAFLTCARAARQASVYVANRTPSSLLVGALMADSSYASGSSDLPAFTDSIPLTFGPSRVVLGKVRVPSSVPGATPDQFELERRVFVVCFDSRRIFVYDPKRRVIDSIIHTGRGPYALAVDSERGLGYVAHFTDSYLGVISLDQRFPQTYATIVASIGVPTPPRSSK